eukprot:354727-Chlamydomonas_euryale.AAC.4
MGPMSYHHLARSSGATAEVPALMCATTEVPAAVMSLTSRQVSHHGGTNSCYFRHGRGCAAGQVKIAVTQLVPLVGSAVVYHDR